MYQALIQIGKAVQVASVIAAMTGFCLWLGYVLKLIASIA